MAAIRRRMVWSVMTYPRCPLGAPILEPSTRPRYRVSGLATERAAFKAATYAATSAPKSGAIRISEAIWSRCVRPRSRRTIRPRRGGRVGGELPEKFVNVRNPTLPSTLVRTISRTGNQPASRKASTVIDRAWENWPPSSDLQDQNSKHSGGRHVLTK